jgi:hypothetical protein
MAGFVIVGILSPQKRSLNPYEYGSRSNRLKSRFLHHHSGN